MAKKLVLVCKPVTVGSNGKTSKASFLYDSLNLGFFESKINNSFRTVKQKVKVFSVVTADDPKPNPNAVENDDYQEAVKEEKTLLVRCKIAIIKSAIFAGFTTFSMLLGLGGMSISAPAIGAVFLADSHAVIFGSLIVFGASFFTRLAQELKIDTTNETKK